MARERYKGKKTDLEAIVSECTRSVGIEGLNDERNALLLRLIMTGIGEYFFKNPDNIIDVGYLKFEKSPDKDELFKVILNRNEDAGVLNARLAYRYYKGELSAEKELKGALDKFMVELIDYSQAQMANNANSIDISKAKEKEKK